MSKDALKSGVKSSTFTKAILVVILYAVLSLFSVVMAIYDFSVDRVLFGVLFLLATAIFVALILIKCNTVFGTYIKADDDTLYLKSWANDFLPYSTDKGFFSDLKPAKTKITEIPIDEISLILIGTKDFVKRNMTQSGKKFAKALFPYEHSSSKAKKNMLSAVDIFYAETVDGNCSFMSIPNYDAADVAKIIASLYNTNPNMLIRVNSRDYKKHISKLQNAGE